MPSFLKQVKDGSPQLHFRCVIPDNSDRAIEGFFIARLAKNTAGDHR